MKCKRKRTKSRCKSRTRARERQHYKDSNDRWKAKHDWMYVLVSEGTMSKRLGSLARLTRRPSSVVSRPFLTSWFLVWRLLVCELLRMSSSLSYCTPNLDGIIAVLGLRYMMYDVESTFYYYREQLMWLSLIYRLQCCKWKVAQFETSLVIVLEILQGEVIM
jgi:hypothetical protein